MLYVGGEWKTGIPGEALGERARPSNLFIRPTYVTDHPWIRTRAERLKMVGSVCSNHQGTHACTSFSIGKLLQQPQFCFADDISNLKFKEAKWSEKVSVNWSTFLNVPYVLCFSKQSSSFLSVEYRHSFYFMKRDFSWEHRLDWMLRLQSRYSITDSSTIMNNNYRECYRKNNTEQRRISEHECECFIRISNTTREWLVIRILRCI